MEHVRSTTVLVAAVCLSRSTGLAAPGDVLHDYLMPTPDRPADAYAFGTSITAIGDLDGDGTIDLAAGSAYPASFWPSTLWTLRVDDDLDLVGSVSYCYRPPGCSYCLDCDDTLDLDYAEYYGWSLAPIGDFDRDGTPDLIMGSPINYSDAPARSDEPHDRFYAEYHILLMDPAGTIRERRSWTAPTDPSQFGDAIVAVGDLDGNGVTDLVVGDSGASTIPWDLHGAIWVCFLEADGSTGEYRVLRPEDFGLELRDRTYFGRHVVSLGRLIDGRLTLAIFIRSGEGRNLVMATLNDDGSVATTRQIDTDGLDVDSLAAIGDLDGDGIPELAIGEPRVSDGGLTSIGRVQIVFLDPELSFRDMTAISDTEGDLVHRLNERAHFGFSVAAAGDVNADGTPDLLVGAPGAMTGASDPRLRRGNVYVLLLDGELGSTPIDDPDQLHVPAGSSVVHVAVTPTPTTGAFALELTTPVAGRVTIELFGADGRRAWAFARTMPAGTHRIPWPRANVPGPGSYFVRVETPDGSQALTRLVQAQ